MQADNSVLFRSPHSSSCKICNHQAIVKEYEVDPKELQSILQSKSDVLILRSYKLHCLHCGNVLDRKSI